MEIQINSLDSVKGRKLVRNIYYDLKFNKFVKGFNLLFILWKICVNKDNLKKYSDSDVEISHSLGFIHGTSLWMEEIFNRYYFSTLNAFVYFGAAILLLLVGLRKFSNLINDGIVIAGFVLEASLLVLMFIFLLFNPKEDLFEEETSDNEKDELISEIGEIARDFANATFQLEKMNTNFSAIQNSQNELIQTLSELSENISKNLKPNDEMLDIMKLTNSSLIDFNKKILNLNNDLEKVRLKNMEQAIQSELGKILTSLVNKDDKQNEQ